MKPATHSWNLSRFKRDSAQADYPPEADPPLEDTDINYYPLCLCGEQS